MTQLRACCGRPKRLLYPPEPQNLQIPCNAGEQVSGVSPLRTDLGRLSSCLERSFPRQPPYLTIAAVSPESDLKVQVAASARINQ